MIQQSGETLSGLSSASFRSSRKTVLQRIGHWVCEPSWNGRGILICMAELALVAASFLFTASLFASSGSGYLPAAVTLIFLPLALVIRGMAFQLFGVCERSFRHAGIADVVAIGKSVGTSSVLLYLFSLIVRTRSGIFLPGHLFIADAVILFLLLSAFHFGARIYNYSSEIKVKAGKSARGVV